ncbi:OLC1v1037873C1 [Oldenlandia corymbosa var. corymbosa]|uniref:OLC1v1037873C1 n=1 Tax=Oldenlandia corymbosa var. corymbosa TaxID=529605 RepID=A0AAV1CYF2_OLDCO|nr:OLC1v1037873C1 [Oldenlandia corymbosa var. corymbosa]
MSAVTLQRPGFLIKLPCCGIKTLNCKQRISYSLKISAYSGSSETWQKQLESPKGHAEASVLPQFEPLNITTPSKLQFDRLQQVEDHGLTQENRLEFGQFVAREAFLDEEFWVAAWLRAESLWEDKLHDRFADNYKRKFAEQEFNALKRRSRAKFGNRSTCVVAVKKESRDVKRTVVKSVVGTLDFSIQFLQQGEAFPGVPGTSPLFSSKDTKTCNRYGYIANLCVAKSARRLGIASNMLLFAIRSAKRSGAKQVFVHVYRDNTAAKQLYYKMGFEDVEPVAFDKPDEQIHLLRFEL